ncbi:DUF3142 domain-containing protein [Novosphingobium piscinae]|uniref:DUF3142 domain-containing protein n=2 Tax=Novosphingobium piscinae TaxID=1507448 RepID=A0A7X1FW39_9SPHN|nr:DUF3142 domain-containing protein [Novosphingobium piscinae]MBC2668026.1 DUF3142 domain-containing protein [Novosphingobium piscinae]
MAGLAACHPPAPAAPPEPAYFVWAGVSPPPVVARAGTVYLLAGEVRRADPVRLVALRAVPRTRGPALWLVVRAERLDWPDTVHAQLAQTLRRWRAAGNRVAGVQIDFDAATRGLSGYRVFLADLQHRLPPGTGLSITGLLDWSAGGDPAALAALAGTVDEIVVQTYQGRHTIPGHEGYLRGLPRLGLPYRVGIIRDGGWREPAFLRRDPHYRGTVEFLLAPARGAGRTGR